MEVAMAMLPLSEVASLLETAHLLRSPAHARRLLNALRERRIDFLQARYHNAAWRGLLASRFGRSREMIESLG